MEKLEAVIEKWFKEQRVMHPIIADATRNEHEGEFYVRQSMRGGKATISVGHDDGEIVLMVSSDAERVDNLLQSLFYGL